MPSNRSPPLLFFSHLSTILLSSFLLLLHFSSASDTAAPVNATAVCNATLYPAFCRSILRSDNQTASPNLYDYGRYSLRRSLTESRKFLSLVNKFLRRPDRLTLTAVRALHDCRLLAQLNMDFLRASLTAVNSTASSPLGLAQACDLQTLMSAILTNQATCFDGLKSTQSAWSLRDGLAIPLASGTKLYSVSLALLTKAWVPKRKNHRSGGSQVSAAAEALFRHGWRLPLKMTENAMRIFETASRRKLLQTSDGDGGDVVLVTDMVTVDKNGTGNFTLINDAIAAAPNNSDSSSGYFLIYVAAGVYEEYVSIAKNKKHLMMIGEGINRTIITGNRSYVDGWTTFNSATFAVVGSGFVAINLTIQNTAGAIKHQAVALRNGADLSAFYRCSFEGYQDTLYAHSLRHFYRECDIYGTVDFIFGNSAAVFQNCNLYPRLPMNNQFNAITAQGRTDPNQNTGISIINCTILPADDLASSNVTWIRTYLGRPWKQYSRTLYMESYIDSVVNPLGWTPWNGTFALDTLYYGEYGNVGPGANTSSRVDWPGYHVMNATDAANYTVSNFLLGDVWLPWTGAPYFSGLLSS